MNEIDVGVDFGITNSDIAINSDGSLSYKSFRSEKNIHLSFNNIIKDLKYFLSGILNFQKGIKINKTKPILREAINMGGTELFNANLATGNALP